MAVLPLSHVAISSIQKQRRPPPGCSRRLPAGRAAHHHPRVFAKRGRADFFLPQPAFASCGHRAIPLLSPSLPFTSAPLLPIYTAYPTPTSSSHLHLPAYRHGDWQALDPTCHSGSSVATPIRAACIAPAITHTITAAAPVSTAVTLWLGGKNTENA